MIFPWYKPKEDPELLRKIAEVKKAKEESRREDYSRYSPETPPDEWVLDGPSLEQMAERRGMKGKELEDYKEMLARGRRYLMFGSSKLRPEWVKVPAAQPVESAPELGPDAKVD